MYLTEIFVIVCICILFNNCRIDGRTNPVHNDNSNEAVVRKYANLREYVSGNRMLPLTVITMPGWCMQLRPYGVQRNLEKQNISAFVLHVLQSTNL